MNRPRNLLLLGMAAFVVLMKVLPYALSRLGMDIAPGTTMYPWNLSPVMAIWLFAGAHLLRREQPFFVPALTLFISDVLIALVMWDPAYGFYPGIIFVYGAMMLSACLGTLLRNRRSPLWIGSTALLAESLFFVITNFGTWLSYDTYPHDAAGLIACYVAALPFFKNSLLSTALYTTVLFGTYAFAERRYPVLQAAPASTGE